MRPVLKTNKSMDDIHISTKSQVLTDRRTRSQSPVKNRRSLPPNFLDLKLPSLHYATADDLKSLTSNSSGSSSGNSSVSIDQIKKLSKSPISKRLHINTTGENGQYVIPIPFTLALPPKLSPKNKSSTSGTRSRSPSPTRRSKSPMKSPRSRLVYTGNGYEKLDILSSETDSDMDTSSHDCKNLVLPPRPTSREILSPPDSPVSPKRYGPPSVNTNRRKSVKGVIQARKLKADNLSIIEELSSNASSRASSIKEQKEVNAELSLPPTVPEKISSDIPESRSAEVLTPPQTSVKRNIKFMGSLDSQQPKVPQSVQSSHAIETLQNRRSPHTNKELPPIVEKISGGIPRITTESDIHGLKMSGSNFSPTKSQFLQIHKRSFSDESHVSSVSSFSSVGDVLSFASRRTNIFTSNPNNRIVSNNSVESIESRESVDSQTSTESWDSVQKSIDLTIHESNSSFEGEQDKIEEEEVLEKNETDLLIHEVNLHHPTMVVESTNTADQSEIADYYVNYTTEQDVTDSAISKANPVISDESQETIEYGYQEPKDVDNKGLGKQFNFPNNFNNITNDETTKRRIISTESHKSARSRFSYYSNRDGQIEIPDLSEASFSELGSMRKSVLSIHGSTFNDLASEDDTEILEPVGIPSEKGKRIVTLEFKHLYQGSDSDSDFDSDNMSIKGSLYAANVKSVSTSNILNTKKFNDLPPLPVAEAKETLTPMRHTRNKSYHSRSRSMGNIQFNLEDLISNKQEGDTLKNDISSFKMLNSNVANEPEVLVKEKDETSNETELLEQEVDDLNIQVAEPPTKVDYQVDFKDNTTKENELNRTITPTMNELRSIKPPTAKYASSNSSSSYQSSRSDKFSNSTGISDVESVVIDLTEEKYDVCLIQRNNSTQSYKSVTEVHKGKEVEVVLVDEDDEQDLESIYSKYGKNWLGRSNSNRSDASSTSSTFSYNSMASESQIKVKEHLNLRNSNSLRSNTSSKYNSRRIKLPPKISEETEVVGKKEGDNNDDCYFDYSKRSSYYDFNTFINQKV